MLRQFTLRQIKRAIAIGTLVLVVGGFSAHAALIVLKVAAERQRAAAATAGRAGPPDRLASIAPLVPGDTMPAPAVGATGTTALPADPLPLGADLLAGDGTVHPAQPFTLAGASGEARDRAQRCLTNAIYYEAASESDDGQRAVAQVVLNRVRHPAFPASVCGVVFQGSERTTGCQFSFACDGAMARIPSRTGWARASRFAAEALAGQVFAPVGEATHYHTFAVTPSWNRSLVMTAAIGAHFFHRWKGWWGTPPAFRQSYARTEPFAGPHPRPVTAALLATAVVSPASTGRTEAPFVKAAYRDSGSAKTPVVVSAAGNGLPETTMLDRWKDTGKPLQ